MRNKIVKALNERAEGLTHAQLEKKLKLSMRQVITAIKDLEGLGVVYLADQWGRYRVAPEHQGAEWR